MVTTNTANFPAPAFLSIRPERFTRPIPLAGKGTTLVLSSRERRCGRAAPEHEGRSRGHSCFHFGKQFILLRSADRSRGKNSQRFSPLWRSAAWLDRRNVDAGVGGEGRLLCRSDRHSRQHAGGKLRHSAGGHLAPSWKQGNPSA